MLLTKRNDEPAQATFGGVSPADFGFETWDEALRKAEPQSVARLDDTVSCDLRVGHWPPELTYWAADEIAECLYLSKELCIKLWGIKADSKKPTPIGSEGAETPDCLLDLECDDKPCHWWHKLTPQERIEIWEATVDEFDHRD